MKDKLPEITYQELDLPTYLNTRPVMKLSGYNSNNPLESRVIEADVSDIFKAVVLAGGSILSIGDTRVGKSQAMMDIHRSYFGGECKDKSDTGRSHWDVARNDFTADGYFMTVDQSKIGEGRGLISEARVPVKKRISALANMVDELNLAIPEVQVEYFGMAEGRHKDMQLGEDGYSLFMASCNLDKVNGDFSGISRINRALLNRFMVTLDYDIFRKTDEDDDNLIEREASGKLKLAPIRDISNKILPIFQKIKERSSKRDPWLDAYLRILSSGLDYCDQDSDKIKKAIWPSRCGTCNFSKKDLCSIIKQSNKGTIDSIKRFALGIDYLMKMKYGDIILNPLDLALESFKLTTYHGNLNQIEISSSCFGEPQDLMNKTITTIKDKITPLKDCINSAINMAYNGKNTEVRFIKIGDGANKDIVIYSKEFENKLKDNKINYKIINPFDNFEKKTGIRMDWFNGYLNALANSKNISTE